MILLKTFTCCVASSLLINNVYSVDLSSLPVSKTVTLDSLKVHETCFPLNKGEVIQFDFTSSDPTQFNLHYHVKEQVFYPIAEQLTHKYAPTQFTASIKQTYCLMWRNPQSNSVELKFNVDTITQ